MARVLRDLAMGELLDDENQIQTKEESLKKCLYEISHTFMSNLFKGQVGLAMSP